MKMLGTAVLCAIATLASTPAYCTTYSYEITRANKVPFTASATDQIFIHLSGMALGSYDCSGNGGFDQSGGPPGTIYHIKAGVSKDGTLTGGHAAGKTSIQVPFNSDGTYITIAAGTWHFTSITDAYLILNAYWDTPDGTTSGFGYLQCTTAP